MSFYDQMLRELLVAVGAALFVGNLLALVRRKRPAGAGTGRGGRGRPDDLPQAPVARTVVYLVVGLVVMVWGIGSIVAG